VAVTRPKENGRALLVLGGFVAVALSLGCGRGRTDEPTVSELEARNNELRRQIVECKQEVLLQRINARKVERDKTVFPDPNEARRERGDAPRPATSGECPCKEGDPMCGCR